MSGPRTFFALMLGEGPGAELARAVDETLASSRARLRTYAAADLHATLFFVGPLEPAQRDACERELWQHWRESDLGPAPRLEIEHTGAFPDARRPRILWAGLGDSDRRLVEGLQARIQADAAAYGFRPDERPWTPHVTVARVRGPASPVRGRRGPPAEIPDAFWELNPGIAWKPRTLAWVESLPPGGSSAYRVVREVALADAR